MTNFISFQFPDRIRKLNRCQKYLGLMEQKFPIPRAFHGLSFQNFHSRLERFDRCCISLAVPHGRFQHGVVNIGSTEGFAAEARHVSLQAPSAPNRRIGMAIVSVHWAFHPRNWWLLAVLGFLGRRRWVVHHAPPIAESSKWTTVVVNYIKDLWHYDDKFHRHRHRIILVTADGMTSTPWPACPHLCLASWCRRTSRKAHLCHTSSAPVWSSAAVSKAPSHTWRVCVRSAAWMLSTMHGIVLATQVQSHRCQCTW